MEEVHRMGRAAGQLWTTTDLGEQEVLPMRDRPFATGEAMPDEMLDRHAATVAVGEASPGTAPRPGRPRFPGRDPGSLG